MAVKVCGIYKNRSKLFNKMQHEHGGFIWFSVISFLICANFKSCYAAGGVDLSCASVRPIFEARGLPATELYKDPISGSHLQYCTLATGATGTCCSDAVEGRLNLHSKGQFDRTVKEALSKLAAILNTRAEKFNRFFRDLLAESKVEFHSMFKRTYGAIYERHSYVFTDLFLELERYYAKGNVNLADAMDSFFNTLYQKMFTVLNQQYVFDDKFLGCVSEHMKDLKPFGDVPDKLSVQIKRSFVATRTYAQSLSTASEVVKSMLAVKPSANCTKALMQMQHCGTCNGIVQRACSNYCINVMKGCLAYHSELDAEWNNLVAAIEKVSERLLGPFNIVMVVEPIDIKISEAIMNFQENGASITTKVIEGCGQPSLGRKRRETDVDSAPVSIPKTEPEISSDHVNTDADFEIPFPEIPDIDSIVSNETSSKARRASSRDLELEHLQFNTGDTNNKNGRKRNKKKNKNKNIDDIPNNENQPNLDKLVKDIRLKVKDTAQFWSHLSYQICNNDDIAAAPSKKGDCWNGKAVDLYPHEIVKDGLLNQKTNPEVYVDTGKPNTQLNEQIFLLKTVVNNLKNAYNGHDVEWMDFEDAYIGSGSGSGDGIDSDDLDHLEGSGDRSNYDDINKPDIYSTNVDGNKEVNNNVLDIHNRHPNINTNDMDTADISNEVTGSGSNYKSEMSLSRALLGYLFPMVVMWFGQIFTEML